MTALHCDPHALAGILRERQDDYEFAALGSVRYYERVLDFGAWLIELKAACAHGVWMKALKAAGWSYSICNRAMKLYRLGVSSAELALKGAKAVFKEYARPRRPAGDDEAKFSAGAKFGPPPPPSGAGGSPSPEEHEGGAGGASVEPAPTAETDSAPQEPPAESALQSPGEAATDAIQAAGQTVRERLLGEVGEGHFKSWIKPCRIEARDAGAALLAPTRFMRDRVQGTYSERIRQLWHRELPGIELVFEVGNAVPEPQQRLPLSGGRAAATSGNVTLAVSPKTAQGNAPALRFAAVAAAAADVRMRRTTRLFMVNFGWRYWPGRPWRGDVEELGALTGLKRTAAYEAFQEALHYGHLHSDSPPGSRQRTAWWPVVEIAAETGWEPPEQYELNFRQTLDRKAADYLSSFSGVAAYG